MGQLRILVVTNMYPPHAYGGYEQSCRDVVERWRGAGHLVDVLTGDLEVPGVEEEDGPGVHRRLALYWEDHRILNPPPAQRLRMERANRAALRERLAGFRPDVVSAWAMGATSLGMLWEPLRLGVPVVPVVCDEWPVYGPEIDAWLRALGRHPWIRRAVRRATGLPTTLPPLDHTAPACFVSAHLLDRVRRSSPWRFPDAAVVHSGIHLEDFPLHAPVDAAWRWRLLCVGRIDPRKGIDTVIRALVSCPADATLAVYGTGDDAHRAELEALAGALGVSSKVIFSSAPRHELSDVYRAADVLVFPPTWEEPFGLVPLEAMASGTPVAATSVGGAAEFLVDGENCVTFAAGDPAALTGALTRLATDGALRRRVVHGGVETAARFGVDRLAEALADAHLAAVRSRRADRHGELEGNRRG